MRAPRRRARQPSLVRRALLIHAVLLMHAAACMADGPAPAAARTPGFFAEFFINWLERAERARASEPRWVSPLVTTTPRLEQNLLRFDPSWQSGPSGAQQIASGPKIKLIPFESFEFDLGAPAYTARTAYDSERHRRDLSGWGDASFLVKYRLLSTNEAAGDYVVTFLAGVSVPTGAMAVSNGHTVVTPTIAVGKGWDNFDIQSTLGVRVPDGGTARLGTPLAANTALQYCLLEEIWPELEFNYVWWPNGRKTGENSLALTPGVLLGRVPLWRTMNLTVGAGVQVAVTRHRGSDLNWLTSARVAF